MKEDYIVIAVDAKKQIAIRFLCLEHGITESLQLHKIPDKLHDFYTQAVMGSVLLGSRSDEQESMLFKFSLEQSELTLNCEVSPRGFFRSAIFPQKNKAQFVTKDKGMLTITVLKKNLKTYQSVVQMRNGSAEETFDDYLINSHQNRSVMVLHEDISKPHRYFGLWLDALPDTSEEDWEKFAKPFQNKKHFIESFKNSTDPDKIVQNLFVEPIQVLAVTKPKLECSCSKDKILDGLASLPNEDLVEIFMDGQGVETQCDYCHTVWTVNDAELQALMKSSSKIQ